MSKRKFMETKINKHKIIYFGHESLRQNAIQIESFNKELLELSEEMHNLMRKSNGIGLAGPQVDENKRIVTIDLGDDEDPVKLTIVNPEIVGFSEEVIPYEEGCLSIPGIFETVMRPSSIKVRGYNVNGKKIEYNAEGVLARVFQHEIDHLNGILFIDKLEEYVRKEYTKELKKIKKLNKKS